MEDKSQSLLEQNKGKEEAIARTLKISEDSQITLDRYKVIDGDLIFVQK